MDAKGVPSKKKKWSKRIESVWERTRGPPGGGILWGGNEGGGGTSLVGEEIQTTT